MNELSHAFSDPQALARHMKVQVPLPGGGHVEEPGNPVKLSDTHEDSFTAPPRLGEQTHATLKELLGLDDDTLNGLCERGIIGVA